MRVKRTTLFGSLCVLSYVATIGAYLALPDALVGKDKDDAVDYRKIFNSQIDTNDQHTKITKQTLLIAVSEPSWCGPCQRLEPVLEALDDEGYSVAVVSRKEYEKDQPGKKSLWPKVKNLPTLVFVRDHEVIKVLEGYQDSNVIKAVFNGK